MRLFEPRSPGVSYDFEDELRVRKELESNTPWDLELTRNMKRFDYDLECHRWRRNDTGEFVKHHVGYVEVERHEKWNGYDIPKKWKFFSFLEKKLKDYDFDSDRWGSMRENLGRVVYLKVNKDITNFVAVPAINVIEDGRRTKMSDGSWDYTYRSLPLDYDLVRVGIDECSELIENYMRPENFNNVG